ncbi:MAG: hypothetical protein KGL39_07580 [Patescibacteria group bacterium]|nr:hypothetical protein [Patescibacteria group bacterium]
MPLDGRQDQGQQEGLYAPDNLPPLAFEGFQGGLQTNSTRPGIKDEECWWLNGFMPVGPNYLRTMWGLGPSIFSAPPGGTIAFFDFFNIDTTPYMVAVHADGGLWQVNTNTSIATRIAADGTISNPSRAAMGITQWGNKYLLIVAQQTNGYWIWDGAVLYSAGTLGPVVTIDNDGYDYTSPPTITAVGGSGSGAAFSSTIQNGGILNITVTNPGSGYSVNDVPILAFSGGGSSYSTALGTASISSNTIASVSITNPGFGYTTSATVQFLGGGGFGATGTVTVSASHKTVTSISITNGGQGYTSAPTVFIQDSNNPVAVAAVAIMPFGIKGTAIETYNSQVWVADGNKIYFSAPNSVQDFGTADGGGVFQNTNSFQRVAYIGLKQTNGFLYLISDSSIDYISGVQTTGTPPTTTFTLQNADPEIGTPYPGTIDVFSRNILFANSFGAHVSYGGAVTKISENLDGVYATLSNFGGEQLSAGKAIIFGKKCWILLVPIVDPISGQSVNKLFIWNGKIWWAADQELQLIFIQHQEINSVLTCYGTDGQNIYPLFAQPSTALTKVAQSKLWARPGGYRNSKSADRLFGLVQYFSQVSPNLTVGIDYESGTADYTIALSPGSLSWTNNSNKTISWTNNSSQTLTWGNPVNAVTVFPPTNIVQNGVLLGMTLMTEAADMALISMMIEPQITGYRG